MRAPHLSSDPERALIICHPESERAKRAQATWLLASGQLRASEAGTGFEIAKRSYNPSAIPPPAARSFPCYPPPITRSASAPRNEMRFFVPA